MNPKLLRPFAVLFGILAISNFTKPLEMMPEHGLVFLGKRLHGTPDLVMAPILGTFLAVYAWNLWKARRSALPMSILYAGWVPLNLYLFTVRSPEELGRNSLFGAAYILVAASISIGAAIAVMLSAKDLR